MNSRLVPYLSVMLATASTAFAQTSPDVVQSPTIVVNEARPPSDAMGTTVVELQPDTTAPQNPWEVLSQSVANFHVSTSGAGGFGALFALRGLSNTPYFSDPAVTVYFADIPLPSSFTYPDGLFGLDSVSVFRGPQGTQFGRATDGGVVVFSPTDTAASAGGEIVAGFGNFDERRAAVEARTASTGTADAEADVSYNARNGYITNQELGIHVDDQESENAFARFRLRPAAGDELTFELLGTRSRDGAQPLVPIGGPLFDVSRAREGVTDLDSLGAAIKGSFALPAAATLTTVTSYTDWRMNPYLSFLVLPPPLINLIVQDQKSWNEEIRVQSDPHAAIHGSAGAWFSRGSTDNYVNRAIPGLFPIEVSSFEQGNRSDAVFGEVTISPEPNWRITAGVRGETDEKNFVRNELVPTPGLGYVGSGRYDGLLPKLAATWDTGATSHAVLAVALGLRPGGFASYTDNPALIPFATERSTQYSAGWDTSLARQTVDLAVRAFYDDIGNYQIERSFSATDYFVATAPRAHSVGAEVEGRWRPSAGWTVGASGGWTDARLDQFHSPITGQDESGNEAPNVPRFNANIEVTFRPGLGWFASGHLTAYGRTFYDELGSPQYSQQSYALAGLRAGYETARWSVAVYGENLADKGYYELIIPGVNSANPGEPRTFGTEATFKF
jgi:iron complex outermembrane recepter protein